MYFAAKYYGIIGSVLGSVAMYVIADSFFYYRRVYKMGYLDVSMIRDLAKTWSFFLPAAALGGWALTHLLDGLLPSNLYFTKLLVNGSLFTFYFLLLLVISNAEVRTGLRDVTNKYTIVLRNKFTRG
jgi:hypothetical protein